MTYPYHWLGHAGIRIDGSKRIYVDPYQIRCTDPADMILVTHAHYDHFSPEDIQKIASDQTVLVHPGEMHRDVFVEQRMVTPGETFEIRGVSVLTVPSYNIGKPYHPAESRYVGYVFQIDDVAYYHAGDTDLIPEMEQVQCDVAFLPVGGTFTMNPEEAARAAGIIRPGLAVPIHWGSVAGSYEDARKFAELCSCDVQIPEMNI